MTIPRLQSGLIIHGQATNGWPSAWSQISRYTRIEEAKGGIPPKLGSRRRSETMRGGITAIAWECGGYSICLTTSGYPLLTMSIHSFMIFIQKFSNGSENVVTRSLVTVEQMQSTRASFGR